jgi:hypothetical protein
MDARIKSGHDDNPEVRRQSTRGCRAFLIRLRTLSPARSGLFDISKAEDRLLAITSIDGRYEKEQA